MRRQTTTASIGSDCAPRAAGAARGKRYIYLHARLRIGYGGGRGNVRNSSYLGKIKFNFYPVAHYIIHCGLYGYYFLPPCAVGGRLV